MTELFYFPKRKKKTIRRFCKILSTDSYIPEKVVENEEIIEKYHPSFKNEVIVKTIGWKEGTLRKRTRMTAISLQNRQEDALKNTGYYRMTFRELL